MNAVKSRDKTIAIVGGGASGALTAYHLVREGAKARILLIDPRRELGLGLAYSTPSMRHLLNVPAGKISALPQEPDHFLNWLRVHFDAHATPATFAPRAVFGYYLQSILAGIEGLQHVRAKVVDLSDTGTGALLKLDNSDRIHADVVVLATGNFDPAELPGVSRSAAAGWAYCNNAWLPETYSFLPPDAPVTLIGSGLTGVDVILRLRELGHRGKITVISRYGVFPNRHAAYTPIAESAIPADTTPTCVAYLRALHTRMRRGTEWRAAIDSLRATTNKLWLALPLKEQKRFRRHLQRRWDVVRHRMAPSIADAIDAELAAGTLILREGTMQRVNAVQSGAEVTVRTVTGLETFTTARVINCTGPDMNYRRVNSPLMNSLFAHGLASPGPLGGGFNCARTGALIGAHGDASRILFGLGPGRLGNLLESIAMPEIREQVVELSALIARLFEDPEPATPRTLACPIQISDAPSAVAA